MAIDICSEISTISPRISFSDDLDRPHKDAVMELRLDSSLLDSSSDFDFCFSRNRILQELSSADELFSDGKILPIDIKRKPNPTKQNRGSESDSSHLRPSASSEKKTLKEFLFTSFDADDEKLSHPPAPAKQFWHFRRSISLNFDHIRGKSLVRSLQFLSRSKSTGSAPNQKQSVQRQKQQSVSRPKTASFWSSSSSSAYCPDKPPLKKSASYGNGVRISSVLNLPPPYISRVTVNLFGFGSIFCNGKFKNTHKKK